MLNSNSFYHEVCKKLITSFGYLFSDITIQRSREGEVEQTVNVPIAYGPKEKWLTRIDSDPELSNQTYITLPRISFEIAGYMFDASRKLNRNNVISCNSADSPDRKQTFAPVPYNIDFNLHILTKNDGDAFQILEQILPYFQPEYTLQIKSLPDLNIIQDTPIILNNVSYSDDYEGSFETRRFVIHSLNFTAKTNFYGPVNSQGLIKKVIVGVTDGFGVFTATGTTPLEPIVELWLEE